MPGLAVPLGASVRALLRFALPVLACVSAFAAGAGAAHGQDQLPANYYGGGLDAGSIVTASIGGIECGSAEAGADGYWSLQVHAGDCRGGAVDGAAVAFAIDGAPADQSVAWEAGWLPDDIATGITLTVSSAAPPSPAPAAPAPTPAPTAPATPIPLAPPPAAADVEARISARRFADGRIEFALQARSGGGWGARVLPSARYFPASAAAGRWLHSSPVTLGSAEARIGAKRLADGRIEFALQPRTGGGWGARVLPSARYFPAGAAAGRWLNSSPVTIAGGSAAAGVDPASCSLSVHVGRAMAATFQVRTASGAGSAFYVGNGEWLTNHHVVEGAARVDLAHGGVRLSASVAGSLPGYDLALLRAQPPASVLPLRLAASRPAVLASVAVVGFPSGVSGTPSATRGVVSKHAPFSQFPDVLDGDGVVLQTDAGINPGNSGGPIVDDCGTVVGIATFKQFSSRDGRNLEGLGFGVAAETISARFGALRSTAHAARSAPPQHSQRTRHYECELLMAPGYFWAGQGRLGFEAVSEDEAERLLWSAVVAGNFHIGKPPDYVRVVDVRCY